ncbi:MAG: GWxTD domain-containing protein [Sphingomonadales bacterium]|nr:GWxTD domain-containing protein [Sphingomonadales bacterium]
MKKWSFLFFVVLFSHTISAQNKLKAYLDTKQFYAPEIGPYLEIYIEFAGYTVQFQPCSGGTKATVVVDIAIIDSVGQTTYKDLYALDSPISTDSSQNNFIEIIRVPLKSGPYTLSVQLEDAYRPKSSINGTLPIQVNDIGTSLAFSSIELVDLAFETTESSRFTKSNYYIIPLLNNYFNKEMNNIPYYTEIYGAKGSIQIDRQVINAENGQIYPALALNKTYPHDGQPVLALMHEINIEDLQTGTYQIQLNAKDLSTGHVSSQIFDFERFNDNEVAFDIASMLLDPAFQGSIHEDSVAFYLESLIPIAKQGEIRTLIDVLKANDNEQMRKHLQAFWFQTAGAKAYEQWLSYQSQVRSVEKFYANNYMEGFETDRGRVYLKYGQPNSIVVKESSPSEYPYEIWTYDKIGIYSNRRFVFYNPDLITNNHRLLHSDMVGELRNPAWQQILVRRNTVNGTVDDPNMMNIKHFGGNSNDFFRQY